MPTHRCLIPLLVIALGVQSACLADYPDDEGNALLGLLIAASLNSGPFTAARVSRPTGQSVPNAAATTLAFDQIDFDTNSLAGEAASDSLSIPSDGVYLLSGGLDFDTNATGTRAVQFVGSDVVTGGQITDAVNGGPTAHSLGVLQTLTANTPVSLQSQQDSGAALSTMTDPSTHLALARMDRAVVSSALVRKTVSQTIPDSALTSVVFESADYDTAGYFNAALPDRLTIPEAGVYLIVANSTAQPSGVLDTRGVELLVNGTTAIARDIRLSPIPTGGFQDVHALYSFAAGDTVALRYFQNSGGSLNLALPTTLAIARLDNSISSSRSVLQRRAASSVAALVSNASTLIDLSEVDQADAAYAITDSNTTTVLESGLYLTIANVQFSTNGISRRRLDLLVNSVVVAQDLRKAVATGSGTLNLIIMQQLNAGDTVLVRAVQDSGSSLALQASASFLQMIKLD